MCWAYGFIIIRRPITAYVVILQIYFEQKNQFEKNITIINQITNKIRALIQT